MFRNTLLALAATTGLIGSTELGGNTANADTFLKVGVGGKGTHVAVGIGTYGPGFYRPIRPVCYPPVIVASAPTVIVAPLPIAYSVYYRGCAVEPWVLYGTFASGFRAQEAMDALRYRGLEVMETAR